MIMEKWSSNMENKDTYSKEEVIEMLQNMQHETCNCVGFIASTVTQIWVVKDLLGSKIEDLGGKSIDYTVV